MRRVRYGVVVLASLLAVGALQHSASAAPTNCTVSATTVAQGGTIVVSGTTSTNGELIRAILDSATEIGNGVSSVTGSPASFSFTATIPATNASGRFSTLHGE